jgi:hypothetical protein
LSQSGNDHSDTVTPCASIDALKPKLAGVAKNNLAVLVVKVLVEPKAGSCLGQDGSERSPPELRMRRPDTLRGPGRSWSLKIGFAQLKSEAICSDFTFPIIPI